MLVLTRREGEEVVIGDPERPIGVVRFVGMDGRKARLVFEGFAAEIGIYRRELAERIVADRREGRAERGDAERSGDAEELHR